MNDQNFQAAEENLARRKSPLNPALASAVLLSLLLLVFMLGFDQSSESALSAAPIVPVLAVFAAGTFAYTVLIKPTYALLSAALAFAAALGLAELFKIEYAIILLILSAPSLVALVSGLSIGICTKKKLNMTSTVIIGAAVPLLMITAALLTHSYIVTGSATETLRVIFAQLREETVALMNESLEQMKETFEYDLSSVDIESMVNETFNILPGTLIAMSAVLAFFAQKAMLFTARVFGLPSDIPEEARKFKVSTAAAVIYIAAFAVSLFSGSGIVNAASENISICLIPCLAYSGAGSYFAERKNGIVRIGCLPLLIFIFLMYVNPSVAVKTLALFGAFDVIGKNIASSRK